jgi:hypothetical protein
MLTEKSHYIADMQEYNDKIMNIFCLHFRKIKIRWNSMVSRDSWQKLTQNGWKIRQKCGTRKSCAGRSHYQFHAAYPFH